MKIDYQNKIEDYLFNRMSAKERMEFEQELEKNAELKEQYEFISTLRTALMLENIENNVSLWNKAYKDELIKQNAAIEREYDATGSGYERKDACTIYEDKTPEDETPRSSKRHVLYWISGIAAVFIAGFFLVDNLFVVESSRTASPSSYEYGNMRGGTDFTDIENLLSSQDYETALKQIEECEQELADELVMLQSDSTQDSERKEYELQLIKLKKDNLNWLKVHALRGLNRIDEVIVLLDMIRNSESEYKEKADSLYHVIKK